MYKRNYTFDVNHKLDPFTLILTHRNHKKYGRINNCKDIRFVDHVQPNHELSFSVYKELVSENETIPCHVWDDIKDFRYVYVPELGEYFEIEVNIQDSDETVKSITAVHAAVRELSNIQLRNIEINTEEDIAREDYELPTIFYNPDHPEASLLHRIFEKAKHYSIKHVDPSLAKLQRTFSISDTNLYDFCTASLSEEIGCLFVFDSADRTVSVYDMWNHCRNCETRGEFDDTCPECGSHEIVCSYGENTNIFLSKENLSESVTLTPNLEQTKNCIYVKGGDDLITATVANCNPNGSNYIYQFSEDMYEDMSPELVQALQAYGESYDALEPEYKSIMLDIYELIDQELYLESEMMPDLVHAETNALQELALLTQSSLDGIAVTDVSKVSLATADSAVLGMAKVLVNPDYKVEIITSSLSSQIWTGSFQVTNRYDQEDTAAGAPIQVTITDDYQKYVRQKIDKMFHKEDSEGLPDLLAITDHAAFVSELKKYALNRLISFEAAFQACLDILMKMDCANDKTYPDLYQTLFLPYYGKLNAIQSEMTLRSDELEAVRSEYAELEAQKNGIQSQLSLEACLGRQLYSELLACLMEDEYSNDNYISDGLNNSQLFETAQELLSAARSEMARNAQKSYTISVSLEDLLKLKEFQPLLENFQCGNWFMCQVDEEIYKMRMLSYEIVFDDSSGNILNVEFSNVSKRASVTDIANQILSQAQSMARSFSYVARQAKQGENANTAFSDLQKYGLDSSLFRIKNADSEDIVIDSHGITCRYYDDVTGDYSPEQAAWIHNTFVFTDDSWKTAKCSLGKHSYVLDGKEYTDYGFNADHMISGTMIGGDIYSANYSDQIKAGTHINLTDGKFSFAGGRLAYDGSDLNLNGKINSTSGKIGCWDINNTSIYKSNPSFGNPNGMYFGTSGLSLGNAFQVTPDGSLISSNANITGTVSSSNLTATGGEIGGWKIGNYGIYNDGLKTGLVNIGAFRIYSGRFTYQQMLESSYESDEFPYFGVTEQGNVFTTDIDCRGSIYTSGDIHVVGDLTVDGAKNRRVPTKNYRQKLLYCYETSAPLFGDTGTATLDESGECYVYLDDAFFETVNTTDCHYHVFLTKYNAGDAYVAERSPNYFLIKGTPGLELSWEIKAKQKAFEFLRLEDYEDTKSHDFWNTEIDYEAEAENWINQIEKEMLHYD